MRKSPIATLVRSPLDVAAILAVKPQALNPYTKPNTEPKADTQAAGYSAIFKPRNFDEYIGQREAIYFSKVMIEAALNESRPLPNIMVVGEYGLGKTTLAQLIIRAYGKPENIIDGASVNKEIPESGTIIIDEIHNVQSDVTDQLNLKLDKGKLTIIGCTTNPGALSLAFRSRFRTLFLDDYSVENLIEIFSLICQRRGTECTKEGLEYIAQRSRFNAREGIKLLETVFEFMSVKKQSVVTKNIATSTLDKLGINDQGLSARDLKYLRSLPKNRAVGLQYLAAVTGIDEETIQREVEPYLMRIGLIDRTNRGRSLVKS